MVVLSFSVLKEEVLVGGKRQTLRPHNPDRLEQMVRLGIQVYWKQRSPEESEYLFDAELVGYDHIRFYKAVDGGTRIEMKVEGDWKPLGDAAMSVIALKDGFEEFEGLVEALKGTYGKDKIYDMTFDIIRFTRLDG